MGPLSKNDSLRELYPAKSEGRLAPVDWQGSEATNWWAAA